MATDPIRDRLAAIRANVRIEPLNDFALVALDFAEPPLADDQRAAAVGWLSSGCGVLTGAPGSGKTHALRAILAALPRSTRIALMAPTARAARVMASATHRPARTIHSALESVGDGSDGWTFRRSRRRPLEADAVVVDESSMIDDALAVALLDAIPPGTRVLLVGDADQLPPVGAGDPFAMLTGDDPPWPVFRLEQTHRFGGVGAEAIAAIRRGGMPVFANPGDTPDPAGANAWCYTVRATDQPRCVVELLHWAANMGFDPLRGVAVLTANSADTGPISAPALNAALQNALNPHGSKIPITDPRNGARWRIGDVVAAGKNDRRTGIANGELFEVVAEFGDDDEPNPQLLLERLDRAAGECRQVLTRPDAFAGELAYAGTVHRWQGGQAPVVICVIDPAAQRPILSRRWLYTALSRFQQYAFILTTEAGDIRKIIARDDAKNTPRELKRK